MVVTSPSSRLLHDNWIRRERFISPLYGVGREDSWQKFAVVQGVKAAWRKRQKRRRELLPSGGGKHVFATPQVAMACGAAASHAGAAVTPSTPKCPANPLIQLRLGIICRCSPMMAGSPASALIRIECSPTHNKTAGGKRHLNAQISSFFFSTQRGVRANLGGSVVPALYRRHSPHQRSAKNYRQLQGNPCIFLNFATLGKKLMILTLNLKNK
jgi:hypothetical protein